MSGVMEPANRFAGMVLSTPRETTGSQRLSPMGNVFGQPRGFHECFNLQNPLTETLEGKSDLNLEVLRTD